MNPVLAEILKSRKVLDAEGRKLSLRSAVRRETGDFLQRVLRENDYRSVLEVGFAYGISSLYIADELSKKIGTRHVIVDPAQSKGWQNIGVGHLRQAGARFELLEEPSEFALPRLLSEGARFDLGFIDGWHTFDHALLDFFYVSRMLRVGGMVVLDDADFPSLSKLVSYVSGFPCFELVTPSLGRWSRWKLRCRGFKRRVVQGAETIFPRVVGLRKLSEDSRSWDWYRPF